MYISSPNRNNKRKSVVLSILLLSFVFVCYVNREAISHKVSTLVYSFATPAFGTSNSAAVGFSAIGSFFTSHESLKKENELLKEEVKKLEMNEYLSEYLLEENKQLKYDLGHLNKEEGVLAAVISKPNKSLYRMLVIGAGADKGIKEGDAVLAYGSMLIGYVSEVQSSASKVVLYSSNSITVHAIVGEENIPVEVTGRNGGNFEAVVHRDARISVGDIVSVPSLDIKILGSVEHIKKEANDPFQTVYMKSPVNIYELRFVEVVPTRQEKEMTTDGVNEEGVVDEE